MFNVTAYRWYRRSGLSRLQALRKAAWGWL